MVSCTEMSQEVHWFHNSFVCENRCHSIHTQIKACKNVCCRYVPCYIVTTSPPFFPPNRCALNWLNLWTLPPQQFLSVIYWIKTRCSASLCSSLSISEAILCGGSINVVQSEAGIMKIGLLLYPPHYTKGGFDTRHTNMIAWSPSSSIKPLLRAQQSSLE